MKYDIIVVGAGHAGCEAAWATSKKNKKTLLITINKKNIADMPCNPSIGGTAKGIVVREIDALGGLMGKVADRSLLQIKMLNNKKGPAVRSLRAQADKKIYPQEMLKMLNSNKFLTIQEGIVADIVVDDNIIKGVILEDNNIYYCSALVLTTGTYLDSKILRGPTKEEGGPHGEKTAKFLSKNLEKKGFEIQRLKTGTPPRIDKKTINFELLKKEYGDPINLSFSFDNHYYYDKNDQKCCYLLYTTPLTHNIIKNNLKKSSMYGGYVEGIGPRYCPSIEDKIVKFADKERHQLFLEPESNTSDEWYLQGFSTSMPIDIQEEMVHSLPGLENCKILKYAYAIEYDAINPLQLTNSLETKVIKNLFTAGQINCTSGYEEAAGQGLIAGINAALKLEKKSPLIMTRDESYIAVLIDDLITKGAKEPYRLLTSRAEFRLLLRHDNADIRLRKHAYEVGMINQKEYDLFLEKRNNIDKLLEELKTTKVDVNNKMVKNIFKEFDFKLPTQNISYLTLLKRPEISIDFINKIKSLNYSQEIMEQVEISIKYKGYIDKTYKEVKKMKKLETKQIPADIDYNNVKNIATEARQKLNKIKPATIAQASRISGVNPADISILLVYLKKEYSKDE